jgi:acyl-CoA thioesterase
MNQNSSHSEEYFDRLLKGFETVPYASHLGMRMTSISSGMATISLSVREELKQPHGLLHGGAIASLIDTATAFASFTVIGEGEKTATSDLTVHFLRPVTNGEVSCTARVIKTGKRMVVINAEVVDSTGEVVATAITSYVRI